MAPRLTSWGQLDESWLGAKVVVRWEDGSEPIACGRPSGVPHEFRGIVNRGPEDSKGLCVEHSFGILWDIPPEAHVMEIDDNWPSGRPV